MVCAAIVPIGGPTKGIASMTSLRNHERWVAVALPASITWALCFFRIGESQFRGDELCTWWAASLPDASFRLLTERVDAVLAPYYLFMRSWIGLFAGKSASAASFPTSAAARARRSSTLLIARM